MTGRCGSPALRTTWSGASTRRPTGWWRRSGSPSLRTSPSALVRCGSQASGPARCCSSTPGPTKRDLWIRVAGTPNAIAVGSDAVWVNNSDRRAVQRIDPQTNAVTATLSVASGLYGLAVDDHWLWTVDFPGDTVTRLQLPNN